MDLRFTEETAVYEFEKMTWEEMDEVFYTEEEIGNFRHSAFMIDCGLEEEDWNVPDVEPLPWPKEIDENKIKKFESNLALLKEKRKKQLADYAANGYPPPPVSTQSNASTPVETEEPKRKASIEADPVKEASSRTAITEESSASTHNTLLSPIKSTMSSTTAPTSPKRSRSPMAKSNLSATKSPRESPTRSPMQSPIKRSYSMNIRSKDKSALDNILKQIESPLVSPKKKVPTPTTLGTPKSQESKVGKPSNSLGPAYKAPLSGGGTKITSMPYRSPRSSPFNKKLIDQKNRSKILASLDASLDGGLPEEDPSWIPDTKTTKSLADVNVSLDGGLPEEEPPIISDLKPTKSADLEHMRAALVEEDEGEKKERKVRRHLMRSNSGSMRSLIRKPRKGKKPASAEEESPKKPGREEDGSKKKKRGSLTGGSDHKPKKRSSLKKQGSLKIKRSDSITMSETSGDAKPKKRPSLKKQGSMKRSESFKSGDSTKKKRPSLTRSNSSMSAASAGSSKRRSSLKCSNSENSDVLETSERKPRRGMKREESLRLRMENTSELSVDMSKDEDDKPSKPRSRSKSRSKSRSRSKSKTRSSPKKKSKAKKSKEPTREDSESSLSEDDLKGEEDPSPIREPRGKSVEHSIRSTSSVSSGVSFLGSIDDNSVGSDQSIDTVDDDELFDIPARSADTDDESESEMQQEFYRYMKAQPKSRRSGVKVYTIYQEKKYPANGKMISNKEYVCASLASS